MAFNDEFFNRRQGGQRGSTIIVENRPSSSTSSQQQAQITTTFTFDDLWERHGEFNHIGGQPAANSFLSTNISIVDLTGDYILVHFGDFNDGHHDARNSLVRLSDILMLNPAAIGDTVNVDNSVVFTDEGWIRGGNTEGNDIFLGRTVNNILLLAIARPDVSYIMNNFDIYKEKRVDVSGTILFDGLTPNERDNLERVPRLIRDDEENKANIEDLQNRVDDLEDEETQIETNLADVELFARRSHPTAQIESIKLPSGIRTVSAIIGAVNTSANINERISYDNIVDKPDLSHLQIRENVVQETVNLVPNVSALPADGDQCDQVQFNNDIYTWYNEGQAQVSPDDCDLMNVGWYNAGNSNQFLGYFATGHVGTNGQQGTVDTALQSILKQFFLQTTNDFSLLNRINFRVLQDSDIALYTAIRLNRTEYDITAQAGFSDNIKLYTTDSAVTIDDSLKVAGANWTINLKRADGTWVCTTDASYTGGTGAWFKNGDVTGETNPCDSDDLEVVTALPSTGQQCQQVILRTTGSPDTNIAYTWFDEGSDSMTHTGGSGAWVLNSALGTMPTCVREVSATNAQGLPSTLGSAKQILEVNDTHSGLQYRNPDIVKPNADGSIRDATQADFDKNQLATIGSNIRVTFKKDNGTPKQVSYTHNYTPHQITSNERWRGVYNEPVNVPTPQDRDIMYSKSHHAFYQYFHLLFGNGRWNITDVVTEHVLGNYANETEATEHVTGVGQVVEYNDQLHKVVSYMAGSGPHYGWGRLQEIQDLYNQVEGGDQRKADTDLQNVDTNLTPTEQNTFKSRLDIKDNIQSPIKYVGSIPEFSATSPEVVFLTHDYKTGTREDATVTAFVSDQYSNIIGYDTGRGFGVFGAITKRSPLDYIIGSGTDLTSFTVQQIASISEDWVNEFTHVVINDVEYGLGDTNLVGGVYVRNILNFPTLTSDSYTLNFKRPDNTYYFTAGAEITHEAGFYQKKETEYRAYVTEGLEHIDGIGAPSNLPTRAAQSYIDNLGQLWISGDQLVTVDHDAEFTSSLFANNYYTTSLNRSNGQIFLFSTGSLGQQRGNVFTGVTWQEAWNWIVDNVENTAETRAFRDDTVMLGAYNTDDDVLTVRAARTDTTKTYYYIKDNFPDPYSLREITSFTPANTTVEDHYFWNGPLLTAQDIKNLISLNPTGNDGNDVTRIRYDENNYNIRDPKVPQWARDRETVIPYGKIREALLEKAFADITIADVNSSYPGVYENRYAPTATPQTYATITGNPSAYNNQNNARDLDNFAARMLLQAKLGCSYTPDFSKIYYGVKQLGTGNTEITGVDWTVCSHSSLGGTFERQHGRVIEYIIVEHNDQIYAYYRSDETPAQNGNGWDKDYPNVLYKPLQDLKDELDQLKNSQPKRYFKQSSSSGNAIESTTHPDQKQFSISITPRHSANHIAIKVKIYIDGDEESTTENVIAAGVKYSLKRGSTVLGRTKYEILHVASAQITDYNSMLAFDWTDKPDTTDQVTYDVFVNRFKPTGNSDPIHIKEYSIEIIEYPLGTSVEL